MAGEPGDLDAINKAIMAGKPESIRNAAKQFGKATDHYQDAHDGYLKNTNHLMKTWHGAAADVYNWVATRTGKYIQRTHDTIEPFEAALNDAAKALEDAQKAITDYMGRANTYRDETIADGGEPDEAGLTHQGQLILDPLITAYRDATKKLDHHIVTEKPEDGGNADGGGKPDGPNDAGNGGEPAAGAGHRHPGL